MPFRQTVRAAALFLAVAVSSSVVQAATADPAPASDGGPAVQRERSVPGHPVAVSPLPRNDMPVAGKPEPVRWPAAAKSEVDVTATARAGGVQYRAAGTLPVQVGRVSSAKAAAPASKVVVETFDQEAAGKAGLAGTLLRVADAGGAAGERVSVRLDYSGFGQAYGGDYGSRLYLAEFPACVLTTPLQPECRAGKPLPSNNHVGDRTVSAEVTLPAVTDGTVLAVAAADSGSGGSYAATDLAPSGAWSAGGSSGDFTYSVPLVMPAAPGGSAPSLAFGYSSGGVDGRTSATNNQASWVGDGWNISAGGFVERSYVPCAEDKGNQGNLQTGDLCWKGERYTLSLGGMSGKLVRSGNGWRPEQDDGSRIEKLADPATANGDDNGEYWKVTAPDGTQYFLGLNRLPGWANAPADRKSETGSVFTEPVYGNHTGEPCNAATFAASACQQAYRWNVDLVVDPRGNAMTFHYAKEVNHYKRGGTQGVNTPYVAFGQLARIDYGLRSDALFDLAPARVVFQSANRCAAGDTTCDVPFDRVCDAGVDCAGKISPAFFTRLRLSRVVTQSLDGGTHRDVDSWTLRHSLPPTGDGMPRSLWLDGITHTGHVGGTASLPEIQFTGTAMHNRVDTVDNHLPITRYRLTRIVGSAGAVTEVAYQGECVAGSNMPANVHTNSMRCYPTWWTPQGNPDPVQDWFHKYVVTDVSEDSRTGGPSISKTHYDYLGGGAWHYDQNVDEDPKRRTWSEWRGYGRVRTVLGDPAEPRTVSETVHLRGMDGDPQPDGDGDAVPEGARDVWVEDSEQNAARRIEDRQTLLGFARETLLYSGGRVVSAELNEPNVIQTASDGGDVAAIVGVKWVASRSLREDGTTWRRTLATTTEFTQEGMPKKVDDAGDVDVTGDESCTETTYLRNETAWMLNNASRVRTIAKPCAALPGGDEDVLSDVLSAYDNQAHGAAPTRGVVTETRRWAGGTTYQKVSGELTDAYGRVVESTDTEGKKATTVYTPATGNPTTVTTTNRVGWTTTSVMDPVRGLPLTEIGVNGERVDLEYDPLGRLLRVWEPGWSKEDHRTRPTTEYSYEYRLDAPSLVTTRTIKEDETYQVSYDFYDGLLRPRQSQTPAASGTGRIITDAFYNSRGQEFKVNGGYYNASQPARELHGVYDHEVPNQTVTEYDDLGRPLETILKRQNEELWRTTTRYSGDVTYTTPPKGDTATAVFKDAHGRIVERRQYHAHSPTGVYGPDDPYDAMTYRYNPKGQLDKVTDVQGNEWRYEYDLLGRRKVDVDPDRGRTTYGYNTLDQVQSTKDAKDQTLVYSYDDLGRPTAMYEESVSSDTKLAEWTYDTLRKGQPTSATRFVDGDAYTQKVDAYDALGRPTSTSVVIPSTEGALAGTYTYGASYSRVTGQLLSETIPQAGALPAENVVHEYNALGLPVKTHGQDTYASEHLYSPYGESLRITLGASPNKIWLATEYEEGTRRLQNFEIRRDTATQPEVAKRTFSYDPAGNIIRIANLPAAGPADTQCFSYDHLRRMSSAWTPGNGDCEAPKTVAGLGGAAPYWYDYTFDKIGNRATQVKHTAAGDVTETYAVPPSGSAADQPHAVSSVTRTGPGGTALDEFSYDANGNTETRTIGGDTQTLEWSAEGRLSTVTEADGKKSEYVYDANGSRLLKKEPNATILYLPGQELILAKGAAEPTGKRYYAHGGATVAMRTSVTGLTYLLGDHHGTDEVAINASNLFVTRRYSDPYGETRGTPPRFWPDDKGLVGGTEDATGLTSVGAREYDPATGRFTSVDPIIDFADPQQTNGYAYANNSPATFSDPTGLKHMADGGGSGKKKGGFLGLFVRLIKLIPKIINRALKYKRVVGDAKNKACTEMGMTAKDCKQMQKDAKSNKGFFDIMKEELPDIVGDVTGFNDAKACFTELDLWACTNFIPWKKALKLIASAGRVIAAVHKALKWESRVRTARNLMNKWSSRVDQLVRDGMAKVDELFDRTGPKVPDKPRTPEGCHSFPPGTRVLLADGSTKPIEQVELGDTVRTADPATGRGGNHKVVGTWVHDNEPERTELTIDTDGAKGSATATLTATDWHPVWEPDLAKWVPIGNLKAGSWLQTSSGTWVQVTAVRHYTGTGKVHDLTVDGVHSYHVVTGDVATLVHNCPSSVPGAPAPAAPGTGRVDYDPDIGSVGHSTMTVTNAKGETVSAELVLPDWDGQGSPVGQPTVIVPATRMGPNTISHSFALPDADAAIAAMNASMGKSYGPWSTSAPNCVSYCADILHAGGANVSPGRRGFAQLKRLL
jgi:RHS repeat-associated protein